MQYDEFVGPRVPFRVANNVPTVFFKKKKQHVSNNIRARRFGTNRYTWRIFFF